MEGGIGPDNFGQLSDFDFRMEIYDNWQSIQSRGDNFSAERFARNKGISMEEFNNILLEFKDYKPVFEKHTTQKNISYETVFTLTSVSRVVTISESSDGEFRAKGKTFKTFHEALNSLDEFVLYVYYHIPTYLEGTYKDIVRAELNRALLGVQPVINDTQWIEAWQKATNSECIVKNGTYQFRSDFNDIKIKLSAEALNTNHSLLAHKLEEFGVFLFRAFYPYFLLNIDLEKNEDDLIMKQNKVYSAHLLKYFALIVAWSKGNLKVHQLIPNIGNVETNWLEKLEWQFVDEYASKNKIEYPDFKYTLNDSISGSKRFKDRLEPLLIGTLSAYEYYTHLKAIGKREKEALFYSGLHNEAHKSLAQYLIKNYTTA